MTAADLHDTAKCPVGPRCELCGTSDRRLAVVTAYTRIGICCLTCCAPCALAGVVPPLPIGATFNAVGEHCVHLGIDLDAMAAAMEVDQ